MMRSETFNTFVAYPRRALSDSKTVSSVFIGGGNYRHFFFEEMGQKEVQVEKGCPKIKS